MNDPQVILGEAVAGRAATVRAQLKNLSGDLERNLFDLGELFLEAQEKHYIQQWGFESLRDFANVELGIKSRRAQYLARITKVCRECGIKRADYEQAGVTKLRSICSLDPSGSFFDQEARVHKPMVEYIVELVAEAPELSTTEVEERVAQLKGMDGDNAMVTKSYSVTKSCYENTVQRCFEEIRKRLGSAGRDEEGRAVDYSPGVCIEALCADFLGDPRNFLEDEDCSKEQIEVQEESNVRIKRALDELDSEEVPQDSLCSPRQLIPSE